MIHISIEAETASEARKQMSELLGKCGSITMTKDGAISIAAGEMGSGAFAQTAEEPAGAAEAAEPVAPAEPVNAEQPEPEAPAEPVTAGQPEPETPAVTAEQARAALNELRKKKGTDALRAVFNRYHVASFPELKPEVYGALLTEVKEEMKDA
ncbi:MAG: hypothetical protein SOY30_15995 [Eubacteriales bacterium]|nr:hypothetical protein [Eubacteriales bacterium]